MKRKWLVIAYVKYAKDIVLYYYIAKCFVDLILNYVKLLFGI